MITCTIEQNGKKWEDNISVVVIQRFCIQKQKY
jgi:hypothetical protein